MTGGISRFSERRLDFYTTLEFTLCFARTRPLFAILIHVTICVDGARNVTRRVVWCALPLVRTCSVDRRHLTLP